MPRNAPPGFRGSPTTRLRELGGTTATGPAVSPEANKAINRGSNLVTPVESRLPSLDVSPETAANRRDRFSTGGQSQGTGVQNQGGGRPDNLRLNLLNRPFQEQAATLRNFLASRGFDPGPFVVGGDSALDVQINSLIDAINNASTDAEVDLFAGRLVGLLQEREETAVNPTFVFNPDGSTSDPNADDANNLIARLGNLSTSGSGTNATGSSPILAGREEELGDLLFNLLNQFAEGGIDPERGRLLESRAISDIERSAATRRQELADELAGNNIRGGVAQSRLGGIDEAAIRGRGDAIVDIRTNILEQQQQSRLAALNAAQNLAGVRTQENLGLQQIGSQRDIEQARLALQSLQGDQSFAIALEQLGLQEQANLDDFILGNRQLDIQGVINLMQLAQNASGAERDAAFRLLEFLIPSFSLGDS